MIRDLLMNLQIKRHELKYFINFAQAHLLINKLKYILSEDKNNTNFDGYLVRSLYFDSHDDVCLLEKHSGNLNRKKYRLRLYHPDDKVVKFEIKSKSGEYIDKQSATISREDAKEVIKGNYEVLNNYNNKVLKFIYSEFTSNHYKPKSVVDYHRYALIYDTFNIRVTFDKYINYNNNNFDIFDNNLNTAPVFLGEHKTVLEVKFNEFLPPVIKDLLALDSLSKTSISKYVLSRQYM